MQFSQGSPAGTGNITFRQKASFAFTFERKNVYVGRNVSAALLPYLIIHVLLVLAPHDVLYPQLL